MKNLRIAHSLLPWQPVNEEECLAENMIKEANFSKDFSDSGHNAQIW